MQHKHSTAQHSTAWHNGAAQDSTAHQSMAHHSTILGCSYVEVLLGGTGTYSVSMRAWRQMVQLMHYAVLQVQQRSASCLDTPLTVSVIARAARNYKTSVVHCKKQCVIINRHGVVKT